MTNITSKIKSLLSLNQRTNKELAEYLGISHQALQNKLYRGYFSANDLIKISEFVGSELAFISGGNKIVLGSDCIRE